MRKHLLILILLGVGVGVFAQRITQIESREILNKFPESLIQTIAEESCQCMSKQPLTEMESEKVKFQLGACILQSLSNHRAEIVKYIGNSSIVDVMTEAFGEEVGLKMAFVCPDMFLYFADQGLYDDFSDYELSVELGKIKSIEKKQFNLVNLEMADGSLFKFLWLWDFEGSDLLIKNLYANKRVNIFYSTLELYDPELKKYISYKVIEGIELGE